MTYTANRKDLPIIVRSKRGRYMSFSLERTVMIILR